MTRSKPALALRTETLRALDGAALRGAAGGMTMVRAMSCSCAADDPGGAGAIAPR